jgi:hypothetical protein
MTKEQISEKYFGKPTLCFRGISDGDDMFHAMPKANIDEIELYRNDNPFKRFDVA